MKKIIRLTEGDLHKIIKESVIFLMILFREVYIKDFNQICLRNI